MLRGFWLLMLLGLWVAGSACGVSGQEAAVEVLATDLLYREDVPDLDKYAFEKCRLDVYIPAGTLKFPTVIWFHGGGLTGGKKSIPPSLRDQGIAVVAVGYRLSPHIQVEDCMRDAAAATAWVFRHMKDYGGDPAAIFLSGHSAGGYLASMLGYDKQWLAEHQVDANDIAGLIPFSGHTVTHFTARKEQGIGETTPVIDRLAPLFHVRKDAPPTLLITGDRELEMLGRYEENAYFWRMLTVVKHPDVTLFELDGYNHGGMAEPAFPLLVQFVKRITEAKQPPLSQ